MLNIYKDRPKATIRLRLSRFLVRYNNYSTSDGSDVWIPLKRLLCLVHALGETSHSYVIETELGELSKEEHASRYNGQNTWSQLCPV